MDKFTTNQLELSKINKVYFVGIGGIGMSALARYFLDSGKAVFGYDKTATLLTTVLESEGMVIHYEDNVSLIPAGIDLVIWTPAIKELKELDYLKTLNVPILKRAAVLGLISKDKRTIAIGGTHGKTTTSSLTAHLLHVGGLENTAFLGGIAENFKSNYLKGSGDWVVVEADEFDRSFLHLHPEIAVVTSMDADHLDIYGTDEEIKKSFNEFANLTCAGGLVFTKQDLPLTINKMGVRKAFYGVEEGEFQALNLRYADGFSVFDFKGPGGNLSALQFTTPGRHNVENATVAIAIAQYLGVSEEKIREALKSFLGIKRRFDFLYKSETKVYIDDYAHHPTELNATIGSAKLLFPGKKILGIFQPHLYSRTRDFQEGFASALDQLDEIILMEIYPARELPIEGVSSEIIFSKMNNLNKTLIAKEDALNAIKSAEFDVLLSLGAGDIDQLRGPIVDFLKQAEK
ncbi:MAG: UDP-N-acetylmuramate--L-alanine ligase [Saprospiraceae bacterium]